MRSHRSKTRHPTLRYSWKISCLILLVFPWVLITQTHCTRLSSWFYPNRKIMSELNTGTESAPGLDFSWQKPLHWIPRPPAPMRVTSYMVPAENQDPRQVGDASVVVLQGDGGGLELNVNRWREQINLPPLTAAEISHLKQTQSSELGDFTWIEIVNEDPTALSMLVALFELDEKTIFVKLVAPATTLAFQRQNFLTFCRSFQPHAPN